MAIRTAVNRALTAITALPTAAALTDGNLTLLTTATASSSATLDFTSSINSTYNSYLFKFIDIHNATDAADFQFQVDTGTNTSYNQTVTSTAFDAYHNEGGTATDLLYRTGNDSNQASGFQRITSSGGSDNDQTFAGIIHLFNPSSSTFVKQFLCRSHTYTHDNNSTPSHYAGYFNTTAAITALQFKFASGNIDAGDICLYGIS